MTNASDSTQNSIKERNKELLKKIATLEEKFMEPEDVKGITDPVNLSSSLSDASAYLNSSPGAPGANTATQLSLTKIEVDKVVTEVSSFLESEWESYKAMVREMTWPIFKTIEPVK